MVLPKYIVTEWYGEGKGVLEFREKRYPVKGGDAAQPKPPTIRNITCYISSLNIREYEEKSPTKYDNTEAVSVENSTDVIVDDNTNAVSVVENTEQNYEESLDFDPSIFITPPDVAPDVFLEWLKHWNGWKKIYVPLSWVQINRKGSKQSYTEYHDWYISEYPEILPVIREGLDDHDKIIGSSPVFGNAREKGEVEASNEEKGDLDNEESTESQEKGDLNKEGSTASQEKGDLNKEGSTASQEKGDLNKEGSTASQEKGDLNNEGSTESQEKGDLNNEGSTESQEKKDSTCLSNLESLEGEERERELDRRYEVFSNVRYWVHLRAYLRENNVQPSDNLDMFFLKHAHVKYSESSSNNDNPIPEFMQDNQNNSEDLDKIGTKRRQECTFEEGLSEDSEIYKSSAMHNKRPRHNPLLENNTGTLDEPSGQGNNNRDSDFDTSLSDFEEITVSSINDLNSDNKENSDLKSKSNKKSSKQKKKKKIAARHSGLAWVMQYLQNDDEEKNEKTDEEKDVGSPTSADAGNIFSVPESFSNCQSLSQDGSAGLGDGSSSLSSLPSENYQFRADKLNLKEDSNKLSKCFAIQNSSPSRNDFGEDSSASVTNIAEHNDDKDYDDAVYSKKHLTSEVGSDEEEKETNREEEEDDEETDREEEVETDKEEEEETDKEEEEETDREEDEETEREEEVKICEEEADIEKEVDIDREEKEDIDSEEKEDIDSEEKEEFEREETDEEEDTDSEEDVAVEPSNEITATKGFLWLIPKALPAMKNFFFICASHLLNVIAPSFVGRPWSLFASVLGRLPILRNFFGFLGMKIKVTGPPKIPKEKCQKELEAWLHQVSHSTIQPDTNASFKKFHTYTEERGMHTLYQSLEMSKEVDGTPCIEIDTLDLLNMPPADDVDFNRKEDWCRTHIIFDNDGNPVEASESVGYFEDESYEMDDQEREQQIWSGMVSNYRLVSYKMSNNEIPPGDLPKHLHKYWAQRHRLFLRYDEGIKLDEESWYSVTPEMIAAHQAYRCKCDIVIDAFCGSGGNSIQLASTCKQVVAIDIDPAKIELARQNAAVYGVEDRIKFIVGDFFKLAPKLTADVVFLSPPWGGTEYLREKIYNVKNLGGVMDCEDIMAAANMITHNIALYLPKSSDLCQVIELAGVDGCVDLEYNFMGKKQKSLTAYFGDLVHY